MHTEKKDPLRSIKRKRLPEEISGRLKDSIFNGQYKPGDKLPYEGELCEIFGVGRSVVREALRSLEHSGLIAVKRGSGGGAFVQKISSQNLSETFEGIISLDEISMDELIEARLAVQNAILPLIIERIQLEDIEALEVHLEESRKKIEKGGLEPVNLEFHMLLTKSCRNQLLLKINQALLNVLSRKAASYSTNAQRKLRVLEGHQKLLDLLKGKKFDEFKEQMDAHIKGASTFFESDGATAQR